MNEPAVPAPERALPLPALHFDFEAYRHYVADENLTEEQQRELLDTIWLVVTSFVDLGFNLHPVQQALDVGKRQAALADAARSVVSCAQEFNRQSNVKTMRGASRTAESGDS